MDWNHAPGTLDAKLLEEGCGDDAFALDKGVRVQERAPDDADEDDAESAAEDLGAIPNCRAATHGTEISNDLCHGHGVRGEKELIRQQGWIQVLAAMRHEVEASHQ